MITTIRRMAIDMMGTDQILCGHGPFWSRRLRKHVLFWRLRRELRGSSDSGGLLISSSYLFVQFQFSIVDGKPAIPYTKTIPTYLTLFIFGFLYQVVLVWDSLRLKNTIQVIGLCIYNVGMLVYASIQLDQIRRVINYLIGQAYILPPTPEDDIWSEIKPFLLAVPIIIGFFTVVLAFIAWKLYDEFAWTIYKHISADLRMKRRFLTYQVCHCSHQSNCALLTNLRSISPFSNSISSSSLDSLSNSSSSCKISIGANKCSQLPPSQSPF